MAVKPLTLRAVNPNPGLRAYYRRILRAMIRAMREDYEQRLSELYGVLEPRIVGDAKWRSPLERLQETLGKLSDKWTEKFSALADKVAPRMVKDVLKRVSRSRQTALKDIGVNVLLKDMNLEDRAVDERVQALVEANVALIKSIPQDCHSKIQMMVTQAVISGQSEASLTQNIVKTFGATERRANTIARDQILKATQSMSQAVDRELGITEGVWVHVPGRKSSRPTHVAMNGERFTLTTGLWDKAVNRWVKPGELILCACKYRPIVPETWKAGTYKQTVFE